MGNSKSLDEQSVSTDPSYWEMAKQGYQDLVNAIIRPPRCQYSIINLGPPEFFFCGKQFRRCDFEITNYRGLKVQCSMWEPISRPNDILPCVIYMHGNSSARVEGISQLSLVLSLGATMLAFDFSGSGMSEGEFVSLGYFERDDLQCVVEHLRRTGTTSTIALWGRSMGAATALLHGERDPSIAGMVLDSAFASLLILSEEMVDKGRQQGLIVPQFVTKIAIRYEFIFLCPIKFYFRWIRSSVLQKAAFDILELNPIERADRYLPTYTYPITFIPLPTYPIIPIPTYLPYYPYSYLPTLIPLYLHLPYYPYSYLLP
jgi:pimeloyl-ACP methyl ester carboxylesterase